MTYQTKDIHKDICTKKKKKKRATEIYSISERAKWKE